jgi:hypothetical protein
MINIVRGRNCESGKWVQLPKNVVCKVGDVINCPKGCICFKKVGTFSVASVWEIDEKKVGNAAKYSDEEIKLYWGQESVPTSSGSDILGSNVDGVSADAGVLPNNRDNIQTNSGLPNSSTENARPKSFGKSLRSQPNSTAEADEILRPQKSYKYLNISGQIFTDDEEVRKQTLSRPLKHALWEIFSYWETGFVFKSETELRDDFIWLITSTSKRTFKKSEIDAILLNEEYGRSEKFFYLFYDIIYRYEPLKGFYWCDEWHSEDPLSSYFSDRNDFMVKYCNAQSEQFRKFYMTHKKEILHFLGSDNEGKLFEDMTLSLAKKTNGEIVLIEQDNSYTPINMGKISVFITNMHQPSELNNMRNTKR